MEKRTEKNKRSSSDRREHRHCVKDDHFSSPLTTITENDSLNYTNSTKSTTSYPFDRNINVRQLEKDRRDLEQLTLELGRSLALSTSSHGASAHGRPTYLGAADPEEFDFSAPTQSQTNSVKPQHASERASYGTDADLDLTADGLDEIQIIDDQMDQLSTTNLSLYDDLPAEEAAMWAWRLRNKERKILDRVPREVRLAQRIGSPVGLTLEEFDDRGFLDAYTTNRLSPSPSPVRNSTQKTGDVGGDSVALGSPQSPEDATKCRRRLLEMRRRSARLRRRHQQEQVLPEPDVEPRKGRTSTVDPNQNRDRREVRTPLSRRFIPLQNQYSSSILGPENSQPTEASATNEAPRGRTDIRPDTMKKFSTRRPVSASVSAGIRGPSMGAIGAWAVPATDAVSDAGTTPLNEVPASVRSSQVSNVAVDGRQDKSAGLGQRSRRRDRPAKTGKRPTSAFARVMRSDGWQAKREAGRFSDRESEISGIVDDDDDDNTIEEEISKALEGQYNPKTHRSSVEESGSIGMDSENLCVPRMGSGGFVEVPSGVPVPVPAAQYDPSALFNQNRYSSPNKGFVQNNDTYATPSAYSGTSETVRRAAEQLRNMVVERQMQTGRSLRQVFGHFDRRQCGYFDIDDLDEALQDLCILLQPDEVAQMLCVLALDRFERISFGEFAVFVTDPHWEQLEAVVCRQLAAQLLAHGRGFNLMDPFLQQELASKTTKSFHQDSNIQQGIVNKDRFLAGLAALGLNLHETDAQRLLVRFDVHGTGSCSFNRFVCMVENSVQWKNAYDRLAEQEQVTEEADMMRKQLRCGESLASTLSEEIISMCEYLGIRVLSDRHCVWIAQEALGAPVPDGWHLYADSEDRKFYYHPASGISRWDHPLDNYFRDLYAKHRRKSTSVPNSARSDGTSKKSPKPSEAEEKTRHAQKRFQNAQQYAQVMNPGAESRENYIGPLPFKTDVGFGALPPPLFPTSRLRPQVKDYTTQRALSLYYQRRANSSIPSQDLDKVAATEEEEEASMAVAEKGTGQLLSRRPTGQLAKDQSKALRRENTRNPKAKQRPTSAHASLTAARATARQGASLQYGKKLQQQRPVSAAPKLRGQVTGQQTEEGRNLQDSESSSNAENPQAEYMPEVEEICGLDRHNIYGLQHTQDPQADEDQDFDEDDSDEDSLIDNWIAMNKQAQNKNKGIQPKSTTSKLGRPKSAAAKTSSHARGQVKKSLSLNASPQTQHLEDHIASLEQRIKELEMYSPRSSQASEVNRRTFRSKESASRASQDFMPFKTKQSDTTSYIYGTKSSKQRHKENKKSQKPSTSTRPKGGIVLI